MRSELSFSNNFPDISFNKDDASLIIKNVPRVIPITDLSLEELCNHYPSTNCFILTKGNLSDKLRRLILKPSSVYKINEIQNLYNRYRDESLFESKVSGFMITT